MEFHLVTIASKLGRLHLFSVCLPLVSVPSSFTAHSICTGSVQESGMSSVVDFSGLGFLKSEAVGNGLHLHQQEVL